MLSSVQVRRRRIVGAIASLVGVLLVVLAIMGMTGRLGASESSKAADPSLGSASASQSSGASNSASKSAASSGSASSSGAASDSLSSPPENPDLKLPLTVLNAGGTAGLASRGRDAFVASGWEVSEVGNYTGKTLAASTIFYPADNPDAQQAAKNLQSQFPKLTVLQQAPADLNFSGVVVVLTGDWDPASG